MKIIYIGLLSLFVHTAITGQVTCVKPLDSFTVITELDPKVNFVPFTDGVVPGPIVTPPPPPPSEYKKAIAWVHGMNGNNASWVHASDYADTDYSALPLRIDYYDFQASIATVRAGVEDDFLLKWEATKNLTDETAKQNSFAIAHSLGGIAIRGASEEYDYLEGKVNGIVTVNSPHGGSKLAYFVDTPAGPGDPQLVDDLKRFASASCRAFGLGPLTEKEETDFLLDLLTDIGFLDIDNILSQVCRVVTDIGVPIVIDNIAPMAVSELTPQSDVLDINERVPNAHKMLFATSIVDNPDAHHHAYKMFHSGQNNPSNRSRWGADVMTQEALDLLDANRNTYNTKYQEWKNHYDSKPIWKAGWMCFKPVLPSFGTCITYDDCRYIYKGYIKGLVQFRIVNDYWEFTTGAREYVTTNLGTCHYVDVYDNFKTKYNITEDQCDNYIDARWEVNEVLTQVKDYDGFLTTESQSAWSTCPEDNKITLLPSIIRNGSDHLQIKNDANTKFIVDFTLDGESPEFFKR